MTDGIQLIWTSILTYSIIQGFLLFLLFPTFRQGSRQAKWLLALLSFLTALVLLEDFIDSVIGYESLPHLIYALSPFWYALGPLLFFYIRLYSTGKPVKWTDIIHFLPMLIVFFNTINFYQFPAETKLLYLQNVERNDIHPIHNVNYIVFTVQCLGYLIISSITLIKKETLKSAKGESQWLLTILFVLSLLMIQSIFSLIVYNNYSLTDWTGSLYYIALSFFLLQLFIRSIRSPKTIYLIGRPWAFQTSTNDTLADFHEIQEYLRSEKPFLNQDFGIEQLSNQVGISRYRLTKLIKEHTQGSFRDFINSYRIDEVKQRLKSPQSELYTIEFIAIASGFTSQATFYRIFKKIEGTTPKSFLKEQYQMM